MTPEGDSRDLASATSLSIDTTLNHCSRYFDFCALPRELRDMVYDQFHELHPDTPAFREAGRPENMMSLPVVTKPITSLLLVNKMIASEYRDACEKRSGVIVSTEMEYLVPGIECEEKVYLDDDEKVFFIHMHAGNWMCRSGLNNPEWSLSPLKDWFACCSSQMPQLDSITVSIYLHLDSIEEAEDHKKLIEVLEDFVSLPELKELKVITMDDALDWDTRGPDSKKLLVHWTPSGTLGPKLIDPQPYVESCCEGFVCRPGDEFDDYSSDADDWNDDTRSSSCHSEDGFDYGFDDEDDDENGGEDGEDDFESDDENSDAGNGAYGDMDNDKDEDTENADEDDNEDSGSGSADTTGVPGTKQAPSYFHFFGLPPEIRDMIYDQPAMLDQEIPLCHDHDIVGPHDPVNRMAATKPRTSLLLVNKQFSFEYEKRCEARSGLFISEKLVVFNQWTNDLAIPPKAAQDATFMHIHAGEWCNPADFFAHTDLWSFKKWLSHCISQMPKLEDVSINLYTAQENVSHACLRDDDFIRHWESLTSVHQVTELRLIVMEEPRGWLSWRSKHAAKTLLGHWKRGRDVSPQVMDPRVSYEQDCCLGSLASDIRAEEKEDSRDDRPDYDSDNSEEDEETRLYLAACGE